jgi:hypothetical protein
MTPRPRLLIMTAWQLIVMLLVAYLIGAFTSQFLALF